MYNGIDRVNNKSSYFSNNVLTCCFSCNDRKKAMEYEEFIKHVSNIYHKINDIVDLKDGTNYVVTAHLVGKPVSKKAVQIVNQGVITWAKKK